MLNGSLSDVCVAWLFTGPCDPTEQSVHLEYDVETTVMLSFSLGAGKSCSYIHEFSGFVIR